MSLNTTPRTWISGEVVSAAQMNTEIRDAIAGIEAEWDAWTPTLTGFTLGNGSLTARYRRVGKTVDFRVQFTAGSTSTFTAGFILTLPVAAAAAGYPAETALGAAALYDASAGASSRMGGTAVYTGAGAFFLLADRDVPSTVGNTAPWTWATGDKFSVTGTYEAA